MLDINLFRENPDLIKKDLEKRKDTKKIAWVDEIIQLDKKQRELQMSIDNLRQERNKATDEIKELKKSGQDATAKIAEMKALPEKIKSLENNYEETKTKLRSLRLQIPNITHESVPYGKDESENVKVRTWGEKTEKSFEIKHHGEIAEELDIADFKRATKIAGKGFYFMKKDLALLNRALISYAIDKLIKKGYEFMDVPFAINKKAVDGVTDYETFKQSVYKIEDEDLHLIATSEHPLMSMHMDETIEESQLPIKYVGLSHCFRKEIGSHGLDEKGFFRVHQFQKVEQVIICKPEDSWKYFDELTKNSEEIFQELKLPYQIVNICTGDLGVIASKKFDLEVWMPRQKKYREACSCSNCTDYQTRRLNIRYGTPGKPKQPLANSLNNTAVATSRVLMAILENYQNEDGTITIPDVLQPYMGNKKIIGGQ